MHISEGKTIMAKQGVFTGPVGTEELEYGLKVGTLEEDPDVSGGFKEKSTLIDSSFEDGAISKSTENLGECNVQNAMDDEGQNRVGINAPVRTKRKLECRFCTKRFNFRQTKHSHEQTHMPPTICTYESCSEYPKSFPQRQKFREHVRIKHKQIWMSKYARNGKNKRPKVIPKSNIVLRRLPCNKCKGK